MCLKFLQKVEKYTYIDFILYLCAPSLCTKHPHYYSRVQLHCIHRVTWPFFINNIHNSWYSCSCFFSADLQLKYGYLNSSLPTAYVSGYVSQYALFHNKSSFSAFYYTGLSKTSNKERKRYLCEVLSDQMTHFSIIACQRGLCISIGLNNL